MTNPSHARYEDPLNELDLKMLALAASGKKPEQIAAELGYTHATIRTYLKGAYIKLGAYNLTHAVAMAIRSGQILMEKGDAMWEGHFINKEV